MHTYTQIITKYESISIIIYVNLTWKNYIGYELYIAP